MTAISENPAVTISLPLAIWGKGYSQFLPQRWKGVKSLERQPDQIVIVCDDANYSAVADSVRDSLKTRIHVEQHEGYAEYWNRAIELCSGKWISICNVDDYFLPEALNQIERADAEGCNLVCDRIKYKGSEKIHQSCWRPDELHHTWPMVGAEPMQKSLWQVAGGFPEGIRFADWGLALGMRKTGLVRAFQASTVRIVFDIGHDRLTLTGASLGADDRATANEQIRQLAKDLS